MKCGSELFRRSLTLNNVHGVRCFCSSGSSSPFSITELTELLQHELCGPDASPLPSHPRRREWSQVRQDDVAGFDSSSARVVDNAAENAIPSNATSIAAREAEDRPEDTPSYIVHGDIIGTGSLNLGAATATPSNRILAASCIGEYKPQHIPSPMLEDTVWEGSLNHGAATATQSNRISRVAGCRLQDDPSTMMDEAMDWAGFLNHGAATATHSNRGWDASCITKCKPQEAPLPMTHEKTVGSGPKLEHGAAAALPSKDPPLPVMHDNTLGVANTSTHEERVVSTHTAGVPTCGVAEDRLQYASLPMADETLEGKTFGASILKDHENKLHDSLGLFHKDKLGDTSLLEGSSNTPLDLNRLIDSTEETTLQRAHGDELEAVHSPKDTATLTSNGASETSLQIIHGDSAKDATQLIEGHSAAEECLTTELLHRKLGSSSVNTVVGEESNKENPEEKVAMTLSSSEVIRLLIDGIKGHNWIQLHKDIKRYHIDLAPAEVARVLKMLKNTIKAWDFFRWASSVPGYAHDASCYAVILDLLGRASEFAQLEEVLAEMDRLHIAHTVLTINTLIGTYAAAEQVNKAERWFRKMQQLGLQPTSYTYGCLVQAYSKAGNSSKALETYKGLSEEGQHLDPISCNMLLDGLSKNGQVDAVLSIFESMKQIGNIADVYTYTIVVRTLGSAGMIGKAFDLFQDMSGSGIQPNKFTYNALFSALAQQKNLGDSMKLFTKMLKNGVEPDFATYQHLVKLLCKRSQFHQVLEVINALEDKVMKEEAYESFIKVLGKMGYLQEARMLFERLKGEGLKPSKVLYFSMIGNLCRAADPDEALVLMHEMEQRGHKSDVAMCNSIIAALRNKNRFEAGYNLFKQMEERGPSPDVVTYNILISGLAKTGKLRLAEGLFEEMVKSRCMPNIITYNSLIHSFARLGYTDSMQKLVQAMQSKGITPDVVTYNHIIECYGRAGKPDTALKIFEEMKEKGCSPSFVTYNIILQALAKAGLADSALLFFEQMKEEGFVPDAMTFTILTRVYASSPHLDKHHLVSEIKKAGLTYAIPNL